ncbi:uncharacterized protein B0T15DRAFT_550315 [Chaetomium strumarium]|uniref:Uncharacterized protein n=1 Tax=Chaetomium strumarium TaxID=1170767 RepID=A0AAJ0M4B4_9PEZI|nr:hypothetical protein B0T15DRAFT_550315 [Chaetomium strumarium]
MEILLRAQTSLRGDKYGEDVWARARAVVEVARPVREATREYKGFRVGVDVNNDVRQSEWEMVECVEQVKAMVEAGEDFVMIWYTEQIHNLAKQ